MELSPEAFRSELPRLLRPPERVLGTMVALEQESALSDKGNPGVLVVTDERLLFYRAKRTAFRNKPKTFDTQQSPALDRRLVGEWPGAELRLPALVEPSHTSVHAIEDGPGRLDIQFYSHLEPKEAGERFAAVFDKALGDQQSRVEKPLLAFMEKSVQDPERIVMHLFADDGGVLLTNQRLLHFALKGSEGDAAVLRESWRLSDPLAVRLNEERANQVLVNGSVLALHGTIDQVRALYDLLLGASGAHLQGASPAQVVKETVHEVVKIPCRYCGVLNANTDTRCSSCGAPMR